MMKHLVILFCCIAFSVPYHVKVAQADSVESTFIPALTGQEVLLELSDPKGELVSGIYSFDPNRQTENSIPFQLIIPHGYAPQWSPHHKRFSYIFNTDLWISDLKGDKAALTIGVPIDLRKSRNTPVHWMSNGWVTVNTNSKGWGGQTYIGGELEKKPISEIKKWYSSIFGASGLYPVIPLKKKSLTSYVRNKDNLQWHDVFTTNSASFSPEGKIFAAETYPVSPFDLKHMESKIKTYRLTDRLPGEKELNKRMALAGWYAITPVVPPIYSPGTRLTNLDATNTELNPLWSPDGKWIAFTVVNYEKGYCVPAVIRPDGTGLTYLTIPVPDGPFPFSAERAKWQPVDTEIKPINTSITSHIWGDVNLMAVEWSEDGKYLWIEKDRSSVLVAKEVDGKWQMRQCAEETGANSFGITNIAYNGSRVAWLADSGDMRKIFNLHIYDVETNKRQSWRLRSGLVFHAIDW